MTPKECARVSDQIARRKEQFALRQEAERQREWLAGCALIGLLACEGKPPILPREIKLAAQTAVELADAVAAELRAAAPPEAPPAEGGGP